MKTLCLVFLNCLLMTFPVFAQGKVGFVNDSAHLFVIGNTFWPPDESTVGALPMSPLPSGVTIAASLYAGTSSSSLALQTTVPLTGSNWLSPGRMTAKNVTLSIPGGVPQFFAYVLHDARDVDPITGPIFGPYWASSGPFTAIPGTSIAFPSLMPGGPSNSTFPDGNLVMVWIPEPSAVTVFLIGVTLAARFRRRRLA